MFSAPLSRGRLFFARISLSLAMRKLIVIVAACLMALQAQAEGWVRINQLGYLPHATKVAVYMGSQEPEDFEIIDVYTGQTVFRAAAKATGPLGQMAATARLDFSLAVIVNCTLGGNPTPSPPLSQRGGELPEYH